jgi:mRNA interferase RelE/StbE
VKTVRYTADAIRALKRHGNVADRLRRTLREYADDPSARANNVTQLLGSNLRRMRVGSFRIVFEESETELLVTKIGPRGSVYD